MQIHEVKPVLKLIRPSYLVLRLTANILETLFNRKSFYFLLFQFNLFLLWTVVTHL